MTDAEQFEEIYREYRHKVHDYIRNRVSSPEDAEDLCSEVFRKAMENMNAQRGTGMSSYIYTITRNTVVDYYRTHRVHAPLAEDIPLDDSVEEEILSNDSLERLAVALRQLDEQDRDILVLHYYANNSLQEIANKMDLPYSVLKRRHQALLKKLRGMLGG